MAGFSNAFPTSFKGELPIGTHNFTNTSGHAFKVALGVAAPTGTYGAATTNYSSLGADEVANGNGYTTGGFAFAQSNNITPATSGVSAFWQWSTNPQWPASTFSTSGCIIYNSTAAGRAVYVGGYGVTSVTGGQLTLIQPANGAGTSLLQLN